MKDQAVRRQREDVVQRQRRDDDFLALFGERADPGRGLLEIGNDVAVKQRRTLRQSCCAAGVLQESDVLMRQFDALERFRLALRERGAERYRVRQRPVRYDLLHAFQDEIDQQAARERQQVTDLGGDRHLDRRLVDDFLQCFDEVLDDDDRARARIPELVFEFARRVERVDVHHHQAGAQDAENGDGILQEVRHHDRDAITFLQPQ
jgi:hypothetical protein